MIKKFSLGELISSHSMILKKKVIFTVILLIIALLSATILSRIVSSPKLYTDTIQSLDEKKATVLELTAAAAATSTTLSLLPGDTATPIAEQLSKLTSCLMIVLSTVFLEKYLLTLTGYLTFKIIIPIICILCIADLYRKKSMLKILAVKLGILGIIFMFLIPASVKLSDIIYSTYESSINQTIESAKQAQNTIEESADEMAEEDENIFMEFFSKIGNRFTGMVKTAEKTLMNFIESVIIMLITACVIPVLTLLAFIWFIKTILGADFCKYLPNTQKQIAVKTDY